MLGAANDVAPVGVCYDADQLNLWRVGTAPAPRFLSTAAGKEMAQTGATKEMHGKTLEWDEVCGELVRPPFAHDLPRRRV